MLDIFHAAIHLRAGIWCDDAIKEIEEKVEELFKLRGEIENAIASIEDSTLELVLTYRYLTFFDWRDVASKLGYALSHVYRLHRQGIMVIKLPQ